MTVKELTEALSKLNPNYKVQLGVQGFSTANDPEDEYEIRIRATDTNEVFITDSCGGYPIQGVKW